MIEEWGIVVRVIAMKILIGKFQAGLEGVLPWKSCLQKQDCPQARVLWILFNLLHDTVVTKVQTD